MLASTIITDVQREILDTTSINVSATELLRLLNRAELHYVNKTRCLEDVAFLTLTQGQSDYPLPANCTSIRLVMHNSPDSNGNADWKRIYPSNLEKMAQEEARLLVDDSTNVQGRPRKYYLWNRTLFVKPAPDTRNASQLYIWYKAKPTALTDPSQSINIDDTLSEAITDFMLAKIWKKLREPDLAAEAWSDYKDMIREGRRWVKRESGDQRFRIDIDSPLGFSRGGSSGFNPLQS